MIRPLTRRRTNGNILTRPVAIQAILGVVVGLPPNEMIRRARLRRSDPDHLPSEVVVYLIRTARRDGDDHLASSLIYALNRRCAANLLKTVADTMPHVDEVRQGVLDGLNDLFVTDVRPDGSTEDKLDFFEVKFNRALRMVRLMRIREVKTQTKEQQLPNVASNSKNPSDQKTDEEILAEVQKWAKGQRSTDDKLDITTAISALPPKQQEIIRLVFVDDLPTGSEKPTMKTAAKELGISRTAVEKQLKKALQMLRERMEADHG